MGYRVLPEFYKIERTGLYSIHIDLTDGEYVNEWLIRLANPDDGKYISANEDGGQTNYLDIEVDVSLLPISSRLIYIEVTGVKNIGKNLIINIPIQLVNELIPVWADTEYMYMPDNTNMGVQISVDSNVIYSGNLSLEPNSNIIRKKINSIAANYLNSKCTLFTPGQYKMNDYVKTFTVTNSDDIDYLYTFYNSYSYTNDELNNDNVTLLSQPINDIVDDRQFFLCSVFLRGLQDECEIDYGGVVDYINDYDSAYTIVRRYNGAFEDSIIITGNGQIARYKLQRTCYDYCIYYLNALGGWDSLLVQGNTLRTDNITSNYYKKSFNNTTTEFEKKKYLNVITPTFKCNTGYFTDEQQSKLYHLIESTEVYLHDLNNDEILPVNITNNKVEYKTFTNNGKKKFNNTLELQVAAERLRR